jgi:hypothetical protein
MAADVDSIAPMCRFLRFRDDVRTRALRQSTPDMLVVAHERLRKNPDALSDMGSPGVFRARSFKYTRCPCAFLTYSAGIVQKCDLLSMSRHRICRSSPPRCAVVRRSRNQAHTCGFCVSHASRIRRISSCVRTRSRLDSLRSFFTPITGFAVGATSRGSTPNVNMRDTRARSRFAAAGDPSRTFALSRPAGPPRKSHPPAGLSTSASNRHRADACLPANFSCRARLASRPPDRPRATRGCARRAPARARRPASPQGIAPASGVSGVRSYRGRKRSTCGHPWR